jgi:hypothetical protein
VSGTNDGLGNAQSLAAGLGLETLTASPRLLEAGKIQVELVYQMLWLGD